MYQCHRSFIGPKLWEELRRCGTEQRPSVRATLLQQGQEGTHVLMLLSGSVVAYAETRAGHRSLFAVRGPGELLGELAVLDGGLRTATVVTAEECHVTRVPAEKFRHFVRHHDLHKTLLLYAVGRLREADEIRLDLATLPTRARLANALIRLATAGGRMPATHRVLLNQADLASLIGATRTGISPILGEWNDKGWIRKESLGLTILNIDALRTVEQSA